MKSTTKGRKTLATTHVDKVRWHGYTRQPVPQKSSKNVRVYRSLRRAEFSFGQFPASLNDVEKPSPGWMAQRPRPADEDRSGGRLTRPGNDGAARGGLAKPRLARGSICAGWDFSGAVNALEDSITAEIVPESYLGVAHGTLAAVNAVGDFASKCLGARALKDGRSQNRICNDEARIRHGRRIDLDSPER
jgi:hypothetical protein